ncbi:polysaccharide biosynthesis/export family protein [Flavobacterium psychrotolerans]|uniref:Polysaccharide export protein N-terminal domain-containing protein n=1 Tax=Flavobacterium psychrotolerans TaxID=2169410 RepID=A0A2U1JFX6_9FLAO|nr:polysaccharide biosynthesis/export family protein [Flavobacterium psychrotolerans]PWA04031.1 hypothetical protein DB895_13060 [Flavobacterium psychrotolerans]
MFLTQSRCQHNGASRIVFKSIYFFILLALTLQSCATRKEVEYFNDVRIGSEDPVIYYPNKIQVNDILSIKVGELIPEAVEPFNSSLGSLESAQLNGYLVSFDGNIVFPRLGTIALAGKTTTEAEGLINTLLVEKGLVKDPTVSIRIINARVTVIGQVGVGGNSGGGHVIPFGGNNSMTVLQAVGNIFPTGIKNDIVLIREENGMRTYRKLDITSIDLVNGPYYYLKQNDVIYVKPNGTSVMLSGWLTSPGTILSLFTSALALFLVLTR